MAETTHAHFPDNLPPGWRKLLEAEASKEYFKKLTAFLRDEYRAGKPIFPQRANVLRALQAVDYPDVRVVILGQDPYHGVGQAVGWCFAVPNALPVKPPSLVNIFKEIETDLGSAVDRKGSELTHWVSQGVLLLNSVLTVRQGEAFSHRERGWEVFTDRIISLLNERTEPIVFLLWGSPARKKKALLTNPQHRILEAAHPSPLSAYKGFFGSRPFSKANRELQQLGHSAVDWHVTH